MLSDSLSLTLLSQTLSSTDGKKEIEFFFSWFEYRSICFLLDFHREPVVSVKIRYLTGGKMLSIMTQWNEETRDTGSELGGRRN